MGTLRTADTVWPRTMLIAMAIGMRTMVLVSKLPQLMAASSSTDPCDPKPGSRFPPCLACHVHPVRRQPSDAFDEAVQERGDVGAGRDIEVGGSAGEAAGVGDGHTCRELAAGLDVDED